MDYTKAIADLKKADSIIKKACRYSCGLEEGENVKESGASFFFSSPDGQNGELYYKLRELGWLHSRYTAEYDWSVSKDGVRLSYTEGDIYLSEFKPN